LLTKCLETEEKKRYELQGGKKKGQSDPHREHHFHSFRFGIATLQRVENRGAGKLSQFGNLKPTVHWKVMSKSPGYCPKRTLLLRNDAFAREEQKVKGAISEERIKEKST